MNLGMRSFRKNTTAETHSRKRNYCE